MTILDTPVISRIRRNHGLEHATLNLLSARYPGHALAGISYPGGFLILGDVPTLDLREVITLALARMQNGERRLALHANCGTNYVVSGFVTGLLVWLGLARARTARQKVERLPMVVVLATLGLLLSQPLGRQIQERVTTSGDPQGLSVVKVTPFRLGWFALHRVLTQG
jgi:hypothetical protein